MSTYAIVGVGSRSQIFYEAICARFNSQNQIAAICDTNAGRLNLAMQYIQKYFPKCRSYLADDFDAMMAAHRPQSLIVCTIDRDHDKYICKALKAGSDVVTEKPMTINADKCQSIIDMVRQTGKKVRVAFNYRYSPVREQVKELLMSGTIGRIQSVAFQWNLDTNHGADYFRRWHRLKENSGGLMVHKATHHFDLVNWWLGSEPQAVYAQGGKVFYTPQQAARYGLDGHGGRCMECKVKSRCNFHLDMQTVGNLKKLYLDNEKYDGYHRDACIFNADNDIEDSMTAVVNYQNGALLSYSLNVFQPWEGYRVEFNGTKGRLEHTCCESSYINGDGTMQGGFKADGTRIEVYPHFKTSYSISAREGQGGHGGGDALLMNDIFGTTGNDPLKRSADYVQGAYSILVGIAANMSMASGQKIRIDSLVHGLADAAYPLNCGQNDPIEYVEDTRYWHEMAPAIKQN